MNGFLISTVAFCRGSGGILAATATASWRRIGGLGSCFWLFYFVANVNLLGSTFIVLFV